MNLFDVHLNDQRSSKDEAKLYIDFLRKLENDDLEVWNKLQLQIRDTGKTEVADLIFIEMRKIQITKNYNKHVSLYYWFHFTGWLTNYGTDFYRPLIYFLLPLFLLSSIIFSQPQNISPTFSAVEALGGYDTFFVENTKEDTNNSVQQTDEDHGASGETSITGGYGEYRRLPHRAELTYENLCMHSREERWTSQSVYEHYYPRPHLICEGDWTLVDGIKLALTYHLPMLSYFVEPAWEARSEPILEDHCLFRLPEVVTDMKNDQVHNNLTGECLSSPLTYLTPGHYTFFASFISWIIIPIYFYGFASRIIRRSER